MQREHKVHKIPTGHKRPGNVSHSRDIALVRGVFVKRFDDALSTIEATCMAVVADVLEGESEQTKKAAGKRIAIKVIQKLQERLFPEQFGVPPGGAPGLVPAAGLPRVGEKRLATYAAAVEAGLSELFSSADLSELARRRALREERGVEPLDFDSAAGQLAVRVAGV